MSRTRDDGSDGVKTPPVRPALLSEPWTGQPSGDRPPFAAQLVDLNLIEERVRGALAILNAIEEGELLSSTPADAEARERHEIGISLLNVQKVVLGKLLDDLKS